MNPLSDDPAIAPVDESPGNAARQAMMAAVIAERERARGDG